MLTKPFTRYLARKAGWYAAALLAAVSLNFLLPRLVPGNPVAGIIHQMASTAGVQSEALERLYRTFMTEFGLDKPLWKQYLIYLGSVLHGRLGTSFMQYPAPVSSLLAQALPWTLAIQVPAILAGWLIGNLFGALCAYKNGTFDRVGISLALLCSSVPYYCLALIFLYLFGVRWHVYDALVLPVLLGITLDEVLFLLEATRRRASVDEALAEQAPLAATTALTTAAGFGALIVCRFSGLVDVGMVGALGSAAGLLCALVVIPAGFRVWASRPGG
jgi:ABC-type dipeptide/oligopeptide/nickel transport system permease component